ncbi:MAG: hypothetical protein FJ398_06590, partial [Verrucomicrobia bacterium]|nr:hypothetical protein [Verrucomicrobiota bacterium]
MGLGPTSNAADGQAPPRPGGLGRFGFLASFLLRACPKIPRGPVFAPKAGWRGATKENILPGSSTEEQRSQAAFGAK